MQFKALDSKTAKMIWY